MKEKERTGKRGIRNHREVESGGISTIWSSLVPQSSGGMVGSLYHRDEIEVVTGC